MKTVYFTLLNDQVVSKDIYPDAVENFKADLDATWRNVQWIDLGNTVIRASSVLYFWIDDKELR